MLSTRAQRHLERCEHRPAVSLDLVRDAFARAGVAPSDAFIDFHERFAGLVKPAPDEFVYGLVHHKPRWLRPHEIEVDTDDVEPRVICADAHPSYGVSLDATGTFYVDGPRATRYDVVVEQDAFVSERWEEGLQTVCMLHLYNDRTELGDVLPSRLADRIVREASDRLGAIYATDELVLHHRVHGGTFNAYVRAGARPPELRDFRLVPGDRSLAQLRDDLSSAYRYRRYHALKDLDQSMDCDAAPLFHRAVRDEDPAIRRMAAMGLGRLRWRPALPDLVALVADPDFGVAIAAIHAVGKIDGRAGQAAFTAALGHRNEWVRRWAVEALGASADAGAIPALEALLSDETLIREPDHDARTIADHARDAIAAIRTRGHS